MSRGFVKEDDQEEAPLIPPRAALPNDVTNYVTPNGFKELKDELESLENEQANLPKDNERERRRGIGVITGKINLLTERLNSARVLKPEEQPQDEVRFGARVSIKNVATNTNQEFQIVGVDEANVKLKKIAFIAPIAKAIIGAKVGDTIRFQLGVEARPLKIMQINYIS